MKPAILLRSGRYFDFTAPETCELTIQDIAHALSHLCRFTGHTRSFYSVAEHSFMVSCIVPRKDALAGLLHDAAEAVLGDVASPLKQLLPEYKAIERRVEAAIFARFGLPPQLPESVKRADLVMLCTERRDLLPDDGEDWPMLHGVQPLQQKMLPPWNAVAARSEFLRRFEDLTS